MNIKLYEIKYDLSDRSKIDDGFIVYDAVNINNPEYYELPIFDQFSKKNLLDEFNYAGLFSPRFNQKTGLKSQDLIDFVLKNPNFDIYLFHPFPLELSISENFMDLAELEHPGITEELKSVWIEIFKSPLPLVKSKEDLNICCHCNYFIANKLFWNIYSDFVIKFNSILKEKKTPYNLSAKDSHYLPLSVFAFERALTHFLKDHPQLKVVNFATKENSWNQIELFNGEREFCNNIRNLIDESKPELRVKLFRQATKAYYEYRKFHFLLSRNK
jgi:hypothetical protein